MSFVGATNVGSIKLHFDENLKTNVGSPVSPFISDKNYASLSEQDGGFWSYPVRKGAKTDAAQALGQESFEIDSFLGEFDAKDLIDSSKTQHFDYSTNLE